MVEHLHILEPLEGVGQNVLLGLGVGVAAFGVDAVGLFYHQPGRPAGLVELPEIGHDITELHPVFVVGKQKHRLEQVVVELVLGDQPGIVGGLVVDLNGHLPPTIFNQKVSKPTVLVDIGEGITESKDIQLSQHRRYRRIVQ